ncbi:MAG: aldehyde dehydrogenase family protein, partial [Candidatus Micrarchaeota archaeon]|nr:aldehyde dehydrogenase family protein [Candidatus Micrarchaeota archaeon]
MVVENIWDKIKFPSAKDGTTIYKMFIDGEWVESSSKNTFDVVNPADGNIIGRVQKATREDADAAIEAAYKSKKEMASLTGVERSKILRKAAELIHEHKDFLSEILSEEAGKPIKIAEGEIEAAAQRFEYASEECKYIFGDEMDGHMSPHKKGKIGLLFRQPLGVVLAISSFNFPFNIPTLKIAPALASGNTVVLKPASDDPISAILLTRILELAGLPKGALNLITGGGKEIGDHLAESEKIDMITFTGSTNVGKHVAKIAGMKKLHMELGGKCPAIVLEDADLELASKEIVKGALTYSGQRCDAISRVLVSENVADKLLMLVAEEMESLKMGNPHDRAVSIGPVINKWAFETITGLIDDALSKGAKMIRGGKREGLFIEPVLLDNVTLDMRIAWEETFGPPITNNRSNSSV